MVVGEATWEKKNCFIDEDGTENDIFSVYNSKHPMKQPKKRALPENSTLTPRASKKRKKN